jgi:hypothetical protein
MSGAREAIYQEIIEDHTLDMPAADGDTLKLRYLSTIERYGRFIPTSLSLVALGVTLFLEQRYKAGYCATFLLAISWVTLGYRFFKLKNLTKENQRSMAAPAHLFELAVETGHHFELIMSRSNKALKSIIAYPVVLAISTIIQTYFFVMVTRNRNSNFEIFVITVGFSLSRLMRSYLVPYFSSRFSTRSQILLGSFGLMLWSLFLTLNQHDVTTWILPLLLDSILGIVSRPCLALVLMEIPQKIRASALSVLSLIALLVSGGYSILLSKASSGLPTYPTLGLITMACSTLLLFLMRPTEKHKTPHPIF